MIIKLSFYLVIFFTKIIAAQQYVDYLPAFSNDFQNLTSNDEFLKASSKLGAFFSEPGNTLKIINSFVNIKESTDCIDSLKDLFSGLLKFEPWAIAMVDAAGKIGSGFTEGNLIWTGSFSVCTSVTRGPPQGNQTNNVTEFQGQYCWSHFSTTNYFTNNKLNVRVGLCFPNVCSTNDVSTILSKFFNVTSVDKFIKLTAVDCIPSNRDIWSDYRAVICIVFCCLVVTFVAVATLYDMYTQFLSDTIIKIQTNALGEIKTEETSSRETVANSVSNDDDLKFIKLRKPRNNGKLVKILLCFSLYTNGSKLFNLKLASNTLPCLNGIRVFSMTWIILSHTYMVGAPSSDNLLEVISWVKEFSTLLITQAIYAVDSFFVLSGLLVTYVYLKECDKGGKISWVKFYVHRYWRLTPVYIVVLFLFENILTKYYTNGPFWPQNGFNGDNCDKYWWWNMLYINNFQDKSDMCMGHSWYLANDMQFYVISPLILIFLTKSVKISAIISGALIVISWTCTGLITYYYNLLDLSTHIQLNARIFDYVYDKPYCRIGPYIMGMICGYLLHRSNCRTKMNKVTVLFGWLIAMAMSSSVVLGIYHSNMSREVGAIYEALCRDAWAISLCWMIFACCNGYGGVVNDFLSWPIWQPLGRLTYSTYLIHMVIVNVYFSSLALPVHFSHSYMMFSFFGCLISSYVSAIFISLIFESPLLGVEKLVLTKS